MHPPALAYTLGTWCVAGAATLYLSVLEGRAALHPLLLPVLLALTVPVTTVLLARVSLRSEEHTSELQSLMRISYAVFCLKKKNKTYTKEKYNHRQSIIITLTIKQTIK